MKNAPRSLARRPVATLTAVAVLAGGFAVGSASSASAVDYTNLKVNFQPEGAPTVAGYAVDGGRSFESVRGYGWIASSSRQPYGIRSEVRDRNRLADQRYDTLVQAQSDITPVAWEALVPNGSYAVKVAVGDPQYFDAVNTVRVEGVTAVKAFKGTKSQPNHTATVTVSVFDGRLTLDTVGGTNTKLNLVEFAAVTPIPSSSPAPTPTTAPPTASPAPSAPLPTTSPTPTSATSPDPSPISTNRFTASLDVAQGTSGWGLETSGSQEQIRVVNGQAECLAGGYAASTHYARLRRKLPETDDFAARKAFTIKADFELPADFYDRHQSYMRFFNTDNYPGQMRSTGAMVGAVNADEWRLGFLTFGSDRLPRLESEHQNNGKVSLWRGGAPLPVGRHQVEVHFTPSRTNTGSWELFIDGTRVGGATGVQTVPATVLASEMAVTRVVGCIDGAADQDTRTLQLNLKGLTFSADR